MSLVQGPNRPQPNQADWLGPMTKYYFIAQWPRFPAQQFGPLTDAEFTGKLMDELRIFRTSDHLKPPIILARWEVED